jgi:hypothetical protein
MFDGHEDATEVQQLGLAPSLTVELTQDVQGF